MLLHLSIDNFTIAPHLEIELHQGMSVITGETGAGKSIMLDALGLTLGDRTDASVVRTGSKHSDIHATFDISTIPDAKRWLNERDLNSGNECLLRRVITQEGRSRGYINGRPATLQDLRILGNKLIDIHGQHAHQSLLKKDHQRNLLDDYAGLNKLGCEIKLITQEHCQCQQRLNSLQKNRSEQTARAQLLGYQVEELDNLSLDINELEKIEFEQKQLAHAEQIQQASQHALALCKEGEINVLNILNQAIRSLTDIPSKSPSLEEATQLLNSALIQTEEASHEIENDINNFELNPERLLIVEQRLNQIYEIARKHRIPPKQLTERHQELAKELQTIAGSDEEVEQLQQHINTLQEQYQIQAKKLSKKRQTAANKLQKQVDKQLAELAMNNCHFTVALEPKETSKLHKYGAEDIAFLISTNPGQEPQPLARTASGGELSRISLAIQVITAQTSATPTLVFDEVDVGIGGATAEVVGNLLQKLGQQGQVLCVTHQPQVASKGQQHLLVSKHTSKTSVTTTLHTLNKKEKIEEIARMLGGIAITHQSRAHAKEMLTTRH